MSRTAPTYAEFIALFPAFSASSLSAQVEGQLALSGRLLDLSAWDTFYSDGVALDAAHNLAISSLVAGAAMGAFQGAAGPVSSVSAAGISTSFASPQAGGGRSEDWYNKTAYGQQFLRLRAVVIGKGVLTA